MYAFVLAAPWVDAEYKYIPVRLDQDVNLTCKYNAEPVPQVDWFYNAFTINVSIFCSQSYKFENVSFYNFKSNQMFIGA